MIKKLGFGLMRLPRTDPDDLTAIDQQQFNRMADMFIERGFNYFDTAYRYHMGESENAFKRAVADRYPRSKYLVADKMPSWLIESEEDLERIFNEQLEKCGVGYFDYYLLHTLGKPNYAKMQQFGGFEFIVKKKEEGRIRHIGFSFHDNAEMLETILAEHPEVEFVQLQVNYIDWESSGIQAKKCCEVAAKYGKPVIVMEPIKGGSLINLPDDVREELKRCNPDTSPAEWAIRWCASLPNVILVLSGMSDMAQLEENTGFMQSFEPMTGEELAAVSRAAKMLTDAIAIPCTQCGYCVEECPKGIAIPDVFSLYNDSERFTYRPSHRAHYMNLCAQRSLASDCIGCGTCESRCPQHLEIISLLKKVADKFEPEL